MEMLIEMNSGEYALLYCYQIVIFIRSYLLRIHNNLDPLIDISLGSHESVSVDAAAETPSGDAWLKEVASLTSSTDFVSSFTNSLVVILITEIGDKTFFIAAVLAMRNGRAIVYIGAMCA